MPNIQLWGYSEEEAERLKNQFRKLMKGLAIEDAIVDSIKGSNPEFLKTGKKAPYTRLCFTEYPEMTAIIVGMKRAGIHVDLERLKLEDPFLSADDFKNKSLAEIRKM